MRQYQPLRDRLTLYLLIGIITLGIIFRCADLGLKVYWGDEVYSSLRIFGYSTTEMSQAVVTGQPVPAAALQQFQQLDPDRGIASVLQVLRVEDSHLPPLYFVLARMWANLFGDSTTAIRSLSVLFSLLTLPCLFGFAQELFRSWRISLIVVAIVAISPIHLVFAQEARFYSLWLLTTVLACWTFLRAMRQQRWSSWLNFSFMLILSFYTQFLALINWAGLALYLIISGGWRNPLNRQRFMVSSGLAIAAFAPWLYFYITKENADPLIPSDDKTSVGNFLRNIFVNLSRLFLDLNATTQASRWEMLGLLGITAVGSGLLLLALRQVWQQSRHRQPQSHHPFYFLGIMALTLPVVLLEMMTKSALPPRYTLISYLAMQLAIAAWIDRQLDRATGQHLAVNVESATSPVAAPANYQLTNNGLLILDRPQPDVVTSLLPSGSAPRQIADRARTRWWIPLVLLLLGCSIISCGKMSQAEFWWNKQFSSCNPAIARLVNQSESALIVSEVRGARFFDDVLSNVVSLARLTQPTVQFQLVKEGEPVKIASGFRDRYVLMPSESLQQQLKQQYPSQLHPVVTGIKKHRGSQVCLWEL